MTRINEFQPDWVSTPGATIADILECLNLSRTEFAQRMGRTLEYVNGLLHGNETITGEIALKLEAVLGASATFWTTRQFQYHEDLTRIQHDANVRWLNEIPVKDMLKFGWLKPFQNLTDEVTTCLRFFNVSDVGTWHNTYLNVHKMAAFRTSPVFNSSPGAVATWLRQGEIDGKLINCKAWNAEKFRKMLPNIRLLTRKKDPNIFIPELKQLCAECGVATVIVRAPSGCRASGATRFLSPDKALLLLSFRHLSDDHFWFTFFHEAGHLLLHNKNALFLEGANLALTKEEEEANEFAAHTLIPTAFQDVLLKLHANGFEVIRFAKLVGVSPGIIVGQLQHHGRITQRQLNNLKRRYIWTTTADM